MLALVVALCAGQVLAVPNPEGPIFSSPALTGSGAFFEFAPASGAGMGTACACAAATTTQDLIARNGAPHSSGRELRRA